jgi:hypothetical protein
VVRVVKRLVLYKHDNCYLIILEEYYTLGGAECMDLTPVAKFPLDRRVCAEATLDAYSAALSIPTTDKG